MWVCKRRTKRDVVAPPARCVACVRVVIVVEWLGDYKSCEAFMYLDQDVPNDTGGYCNQRY